MSLQGMQFLFSWGVGLALDPVHPKAMPGSWPLSGSWVWRSRLPQSCKAVTRIHTPGGYFGQQGYLFLWWLLDVSEQEALLERTLS